MPNVFGWNDIVASTPMAVQDMHSCIHNLFPSKHAIKTRLAWSLTQGSKMAIQTKTLGQRTTTFVFRSNHVEVKPSGFALEDEEKDWVVTIGLGLFALKYHDTNEIVAQFEGDIKLESSLHATGYAVKVSETHVLDCYDHKHHCRASMINSVNNALDTKTGEPAVFNCRFYQQTNTAIVTVRTRAPVHKGREFGSTYGNRIGCGL
jgi:translation elongation factor EF-1alpha